MRNGDWKCHNCKGHVFSHKLQCKCGSYRYKVSPAYINLTNSMTNLSVCPEYWICTDCKTRYQKDVKSCLKCSRSFTTSIA